MTLFLSALLAVCTPEPTLSVTVEYAPSPTGPWTLDCGLHSFPRGDLFVRVDTTPSSVIISTSTNVLGPWSNHVYSYFYPERTFYRVRHTLTP